MHQNYFRECAKKLNSLAACSPVPRPVGPAYFSGSYKTGHLVGVLPHSMSFVFPVEGWVATGLCFEIL